MSGNMATAGVEGLVLGTSGRGLLRDAGFSGGKATERLKGSTP
jgi:hypothetical protein